MKKEAENGEKGAPANGQRSKSGAGEEEANPGSSSKVQQLEPNARPRRRRTPMPVHDDGGGSDEDEDEEPETSDSGSEDTPPAAATAGERAAAAGEGASDAAKAAAPTPKPLTADATGFTKLHYAASNKDLNALKTLLSQGHHPDQDSITKTTSKLTPLMLACLPATAREALRKNNFYNVLTKTLAGESTACADDVALLLLKHGADPNAKHKGLTPLHVAAASGSVDIIHTLLKNGASLKKADEVAGYTPLMVASMLGHAEVVKVLIAEGTDVKAKREDTQDAPLHYAAQGKHVECVKLLLEAGADVAARTAGQTSALHEGAALYKSLKNQDQVMRIIKRARGA